MDDWLLMSYGLYCTGLAETNARSASVLQFRDRLVRIGADPGCSLVTAVGVARGRRSIGVLQVGRSAVSDRVDGRSSWTSGNYMVQGTPAVLLRGCSAAHCQGWLRLASGRSQSIDYADDVGLSLGTGDLHSVYIGCSIISSRIRVGQADE